MHAGRGPHPLVLEVLHQARHLAQVGLHLGLLVAEAVQLPPQVGHVGVEHGVHAGARRRLLLHQLPLGLQHLVLLLQEAHLQTPRPIREEQQPGALLRLRVPAVAHLVDEGGEAVVEGLDLLLLLGADHLDVGVDLQVQGGQQAPVHRHRRDGRLVGRAASAEAHVAELQSAPSLRRPPGVVPAGHLVASGVSPGGGAQRPLCRPAAGPPQPEKERLLKPWEGPLEEEEEEVEKPVVFKVLRDMVSERRAAGPERETRDSEGKESRADAASPSPSGIYQSRGGTRLAAVEAGEWRLRGVEGGGWRLRGVKTEGVEAEGRGGWRGVKAEVGKDQGEWRLRGGGVEGGAPGGPNTDQESSSITDKKLITGTSKGGGLISLYGAPHGDNGGLFPEKEPLWAGSDLIPSWYCLSR
ncbi:hypothetical protein EYF80_035894 [Liparis tanakae]|uniref:Uncharacterized protein n=1 Tax=Liparis tanakae TaxID=230148 RepID=A0A4Z2GK85_9TELE|nr:hypothetical protein EYF80_035894 [Liparis tanakae]